MAGHGTCQVRDELTQPAWGSAWPPSPPTARCSTPGSRPGSWVSASRCRRRRAPRRAAAAEAATSGRARCPGCDAEVVDRRDRLAGRPDQGRLRRVPAAAPALPPPGPAATSQPRRHLRAAGQRRLDLGRAVPAGAGRRAAADRARGRAAPGRVRGGQVPADDRLRGAVRRADRRRRPGPAGRPPRRRHHGHARGLRATSTPARWAPRWSRAGSSRAWWSATAPTSAAAPRSWARSPAAAPRRSASASGACSAPTRASASRSATTAWSRRAATSPPARRSPCRTGGWSRPASCPASTGCCSGATR